MARVERRGDGVHRLEARIDGNYPVGARAEAAGLLSAVDDGRPAVHLLARARHAGHRAVRRLRLGAHVRRQATQERLLRGHIAQQMQHRDDGACAGLGEGGHGVREAAGEQIRDCLAACAQDGSLTGRNRQAVAQLAQRVRALRRLDLVRQRVQVVLRAKLELAHQADEEQHGEQLRERGAGVDDGHRRRGDEDAEDEQVAVCGQQDVRACIQQHSIAEEAAAQRKPGGVALRAVAAQETRTRLHVRQHHQDALRRAVRQQKHSRCEERAGHALHRHRNGVPGRQRAVREREAQRGPDVERVAHNLGEEDARDGQLGHEPSQAQQRRVHPPVEDANACRRPRVGAGRAGDAEREVMHEHQFHAKHLDDLHPKRNVRPPRR